VPYLPMDPADVGRSYDSVIRVNSQSGKGGVAYLMEVEHGVVMPRRLQIEFSNVFKEYTDAVGGEVAADMLWTLFSKTYLDTTSPLVYREHSLFDKDGKQGIRLSVDIEGVSQILTGEGNGPIDAAVHALRNAGIHIQVRSYEERSMAPSADAADARACAFIEIGAHGREFYGVGIDSNIVTASVKAMISSVNRANEAVPVRVAA